LEPVKGWKECGACGVVLMNKRGQCPKCGKYLQNKNHAKVVSFSGHTFRSKAESERFTHLAWKQQAGLIQGLLHHPPKITLLPGLTWSVDFYYFDLDRKEATWEEFKGKEEPEYLAKLAVWKYLGPGFLRVVKKTAGLFCVSQEVSPLGIERLGTDLLSLRSCSPAWPG
jgi:hypothetical protein